MTHRPRHMAKVATRRKATASQMILFRVGVVMATISMSTGGTIKLLGPAITSFLAV